MSDGGASWDKRRDILHSDMTTDSEGGRSSFAQSPRPPPPQRAGHSRPHPRPHHLPPTDIVGGMILVMAPPPPDQHKPVLSRYCTFLLTPRLPDSQLSLPFMAFTLPNHPTVGCPTTLTTPPPPMPSLPSSLHSLQGPCASLHHVTTWPMTRVMALSLSTLRDPPERSARLRKVLRRVIDAEGQRSDE